jgi:hypothetical protein
MRLLSARRGQSGLRDRFQRGTVVSRCLPVVLAALVLASCGTRDQTAHYLGEKLWTVMPAPFVVKQHVATFKGFPPRQAPGNVNTEDMTKNILELAADSNL